MAQARYYGLAEGGDLAPEIVLRTMINDTCPAHVMTHTSDGGDLPAALHGNLRVYTYDLHCAKFQALVMHRNNAFPNIWIIDWFTCQEGEDIPQAWLTYDTHSEVGKRIASVHYEEELKLLSHPSYGLTNMANMQPKDRNREAEAEAMRQKGFEAGRKLGEELKALGEGFKTGWGDIEDDKKLGGGS